MVGGRAVGPRLRGGGLTLLAISAQHLKVGEREQKKDSLLRRQIR